MVGVLRIFFGLKGTIKDMTDKLHHQVAIKYDSPRYLGWWVFGFPIQHRWILCLGLKFEAPKTHQKQTLWKGWNCWRWYNLTRPIDPPRRGVKVQPPKKVCFWWVFWASNFSPQTEDSGKSNFGSSISPIFCRAKKNQRNDCDDWYFTT